MPGRIKVQVLADADAVARAAAGVIVSLVRDNPDAVLGLPTGSTPERTFEEVVRLSRAEGVSFAKVTTFNLDEYFGLSGDHSQSYRAFMNERLFKHLDIRLWNTHVFNGLARSPEDECAAFERKIAACGGIDLWFLGIGTNAHIAFNEPGSPADGRSRKVPLSEATIAANSDGRFFKDPNEVPRHALTVGLGTVLDARRLLLLAMGEKKAAAIAASVKGPVTTDAPGSLLQHHPDCTFMLDRAAAAGL